MAKKYIDADVLVKKMLERGWRHPDETTREFVEDDLPAADVVEVVRCKDCKYRYVLNRGESSICNLLDAQNNGEAYCSYGERKGGAE